MKRSTFGSLLLLALTGACSPGVQDSTEPLGAGVADPALLEVILEDVRVGWELGDGTPFYRHFLDWTAPAISRAAGRTSALPISS